MEEGVGGREGGREAVRQGSRQAGPEIYTNRSFNFQSCGMINEAQEGSLVVMITLIVNLLVQVTCAFPQCQMVILRKLQLV